MQSLNVQMAGLHTNPNPFSKAPPGALLKAKNMVVDKDGIVESRRGFKRYGGALTLAGGEKINALLNYKDRLIVHYGSKLAYDSDGSGTWSDYSGSYAAPSGATAIRSLEANKNLFISTSSGVKKLDTLTGTIGQAGMYKGLNAVASLTGASGFLTDAYYVAYRVVWGILDANNNLILGAPSERIIIQNTTGGGTTKNVQIVITIPSGITVNHFFQIYRSLMSAATPNDELGLVYENNPVSGDISAGSVTVTDTVPESLRGATLYTSPSQQGIGQANDQPPLCKDMCFYKNQVMYANTISKQRKIFTLLAVGGSALVADDTITIGGVLYTAKSSETVASGYFKVDTSGSAAANIESTARSLVKVINGYATNASYYAYYLSGYGDLPGKILIEERSIGGAAYALIASRGSAFNPVLPTSGTTVSSSSDIAKNRVWITKYGQPEAVPLSNFIDIGSADKDIVRIIPLRDSVFVFKKDGVFRITGETLSSFQVSLFDVTVILSASETAVPFNNQVFAYTSQGVVGVSDTGSAIMSRPIEVDLLPIANFSSFTSLSFGIAYSSDRKYILFNQKTATDTYQKQAWVYNAISNAWTRWERNFSCGIVNSNDDKLYFGAADSAYVYQERKSFDVTDYADEEVGVTISASSGTAVTVASTSGVSAGWTLVQGGNLSRIVSVDSSTKFTVTDTGLSWKSGAATAYNPISVEVETVQQFANNPGVLKHFRDLTVIFRHAQFKSLSVGLKSNISDFSETTNLTVAGLGWGKVPWGQLGWGGHDLSYRTVRTFIPRNKQRAHWLTVVITHAIAREYFAVAGISLQYDVMSERTK